METVDVIIIGAGIAGLVAARELHEAGLSLIVLEKSRGLGGRMAARRMGEAVFDHGAQFFTVRSSRFSKLVDAMLADGAAAHWFGGDEWAAHVRYRGAPSMTGPAKWLARGLDIRGNSQVFGVCGGPGGTMKVDVEGGGALAARHVLLTAPVPQSLSLLDAGKLPLESALFKLLQEVTYAPCFALMAVLRDGGSAISGPGFVEPEGASEIAWVADNRAKGVSPVACSLTIHATREFSLEHFDLAPTEVTQRLLAAAEPWIKGEVVETRLHRWRYARVTKGLDQRMAHSDGNPLTFAGDAFGAPTVEGAALSGWAAAEQMLGQLSLR